MPSVVGAPADDARRVLEHLGLAVAAEQWWNREAPAGSVVYQHPQPQEPVDQGKPAVIVVSRGPIRVTVPDLVGHRQDEARHALQQAGLLNAPVIHTLRSKDLPPALQSTVCDGCVLRVTPPPGAEVPPEGIVTLTVRRD